MADLRRCIGSAKFGIEAHEAPSEDFPAQPSQKDGLGRMCRPHWNQYTGALRNAAMARKPADGAEPTAGTVTIKPVREKPIRQTAQEHVELLDPPVSRPRRKASAAAASETSIG